MPQTMMKAAVYYGKGDVRVEDVAAPTPAPQQYLIEVAWCGICGSDLHEYTSGPIGIPTPEKPHPLTGGHAPAIMGHEFCGHVRLAPSDGKFKVGEAVMVDPHFTCGLCGPCRSDREHLCEKMGFLGASGGYAGGGLSQFVAVDAVALHRLPDTISVEDAAVIEPLTVAHHAISLTRMDTAADDFSILVVGGGPIGYALALTLRAHGAKLIMLSEPTIVRRDAAMEVVDVILDPTTEKIGDKCREATSGLGVDLVFDCAGTRRGSEDAFDAIRYGGTWVNVAMWASSVFIPYYPFFRKEVKFLSSCCYNRRDFEQVMKLIEQGKFQGYQKMITRRVALKDVVKDGFEELLCNKDKHIKILISPRATGENSLPPEGS